jgi:hypothetical protein
MSDYPPKAIELQTVDTFWWHVPDGWNDQLEQLHEAFVKIDPKYQFKLALFCPAQNRGHEGVLNFFSSLQENLEANILLKRTKLHLAETCMICGLWGVESYEFLNDFFPLCFKHLKQNSNRIAWAQHNPHVTRIGIEEFVSPITQQYRYVKKPRVRQ